MGKRIEELETPAMRWGVELLPCPFCRCEEIWILQADLEMTYLRHAVCCGCGARTGRKDSAEEAVAAWNRRAALSKAEPLP